MKKNISINISGIIFHIEEDGYEILKKYLDSVNLYFASYEGSAEIIADIESRIAEIFFSKLNVDKQVITLEDVQALIATMGNVSDFQAAEEKEFAEDGTKEETASGSDQSTAPPKRLMRDMKNKVLGGVCAGIAHYFNTDPVWIRIAFALTVVLNATLWSVHFHLRPVIMMPVSTLLMLIYFILWFVIPESYDLPDQSQDRKLFRDPERKALGGVSGGLSSFFKMDIIIVRILFIVLACAYGIGIAIYFVLWVVVPEAKTRTDKMRMQGEPVTLSNIKNTIRNSGSTKDDDENIFTRILLFPFRIINGIIEFLGKLLTPIVELFRFMSGILITLLGLGMIFITVVFLSMVMGFYSLGNQMMHLNFPVEALQHLISPISTIAALLVVAIPAVLLVLLGISIIAKRIIFIPVIGWSLLILFFVSVGIVAFHIPPIIYSFKENGEFKVEHEFDPGNHVALLKVRETGMDDYHETSLQLEGYDGQTFKLVQYFKAQGSSRKEAIQNAKMVSYEVSQDDSVLLFDSNITFNPDAVFKGQRLLMTLYVPNGHPFRIDRDVYRILNTYTIPWNSQESWKYEDGNLVCITCPPDANNNTKDLRDFNELRLSGLFDVHISRGNYNVTISGSDDEKEKYNVYRKGDILFVDYNTSESNFWENTDFNLDEVNINISMPDLEGIKIKGAGKVTYSGFNENSLNIDALGAVKIYGNADFKNLGVNLNGASSLTLQGKGSVMNVFAEGASFLHAFSYPVESAIVKVGSASHANVNVTGSLEIDEGVASKVEYQGNPKNVIKN